MTSDYFVIDGLYKAIGNSHVYRCVGYCDVAVKGSVYLVDIDTPDAKKFPYTYFEGLLPFSAWWEVISTPEHITEGEMFV